MKKYLLAISLTVVAWSLLSCSQDDDQPSQPRRMELTLRVGADVPDAGSALSPALNRGQHRTVLMSDGTTVAFLHDDDLSVFDYENNNQHFLRSDNGGDGTTTAVFHGTVVANQTKTFHALHPYQKGAQCVSNDGKNYIRAVIPTVQTATAGSFDPKANLSVAAFVPDAKGNGAECTLHNACALVRLTITHGACKTVRLESIAGKQLSGTYLIGPIAPPAGAAENDEYVDGVTASAPKASYVELTALSDGMIASGTYYIAVSPKATSRMKITFTNAEGKSVSSTTKGDVSLGQGLVTNLGTFNLPD